MAKRVLGLLSLSVLLITLPVHAEIVFSEVTGTAGIGSYSMQTGFGGGVAAADYDKDGDIDLFVPQEFGSPNLLYRNLGDGTYEEIAASVGLADTDRTRIGLWFDYGRRPDTGPADTWRL